MLATGAILLVIIIAIVAPLLSHKGIRLRLQGN